MCQPCHVLTAPGSGEADDGCGRSGEGVEPSRRASGAACRLKRPVGAPAPGHSTRSGSRCSSVAAASPAGCSAGHFRHRRRWSRPWPGTAGIRVGETNRCGGPSAHRDGSGLAAKHLPTTTPQARRRDRRHRRQQPPRSLASASSAARQGRCPQAAAGHAARAGSPGAPATRLPRPCGRTPRRARAPSTGVSRSREQPPPPYHRFFQLEPLFN
jgi:hypothetical protein